jgi:hypothetical protein
MKIVKPPEATECPICHSKNIEAFYEVTTGDVCLWLATLFTVLLSHLHYQCQDCKCIWRD